MKFINYCSILLLLLTLMSCNSSIKSEPQYLIGGSGWKKNAKVDEKGKVLWSHNLEQNEECNSVTNLPNNKILYSFKKGIKVIDKEHNVQWEYKSRDKAEIHSASLTKDGNILIGECGNPAKIYEFSLEGEKLVSVDFETGVDNPHGQFRRVSKTEDNTYLVPVLGKRSILELDRSGQLIKESKLNYSVFSMLVLENKNWLLSCGDKHKLVEYNPLNEEIVWELGEKDIKEFPLRYVAEAIRLENGNTIICNWGGHSHAKGPKVPLFEIDKNKNVVWKITDDQNLGNVSTIDPDIRQEYLR